MIKDPYFTDSDRAVTVRHTTVTGLRRSEAKTHDYLSCKARRRVCICHGIIMMSLHKKYAFNAWCTSQVGTDNLRTLNPGPTAYRVCGILACEEMYQNSALHNAEELILPRAPNSESVAVYVRANNMGKTKKVFNPLVHLPSWRRQLGNSEPWTHCIPRMRYWALSRGNSVSSAQQLAFCAQLSAR